MIGGRKGSFLAKSDNGVLRALYTVELFYKKLKNNFLNTQVIGLLPCSEMGQEEINFTKYTNRATIQ